MLEAWSRSYRIGSFPSFWERLTKLIADGRCVICEEVHTEIQDDSAGLADWAKGQLNFVVDFDRRQEILVQEIMRDYPRLVNTTRNKGWADPFVIALAESRKLTVVTEEGRGAEDGPRIPFVCKRRSVPCVKLIELIETEGWSF